LAFFNGLVSSLHRSGDSRNGDATHADMFRDLFALIDVCPHVTFVLPTSHIPSTMGDLSALLKSPASTYGNLIIAARATTQAEVDERVPKLLQLSDLCGGLGLWCQGLRERVDVSRYVPSPDGFVCPDLAEGAIHIEDGGVALQHVWASVGRDDIPSHKAVADLREQCEAAGVEFEEITP
jgi:hypothetical protein